MSKTKQNFIYNLIYQILILIIPIITASYTSRVIGANGIGIYSYTYSIVYYFMLLTLLGVNNYGNRTIAKVRDNKEKLYKNFWSIYCFQVIMGIIMLTLYILYILVFNIQYKSIAVIETMFIISSMLDINWLFFGLEEFKKNIMRNTFIKVANVILVVIFVKSSNDVWKYTLIMSSMTLLSQIIMWPLVLKIIKFRKVTLKEIANHIKPNLILFIPVIAVSIYKMMDKIMLGNMAKIVEVGYYENAEKIINIPTAIISTLGTVMLPKMSNIVAKGDESKMSEYIEKSIYFIMFMSLPMSLGLIAIGRNFAPLFFGEQFKKTGYIIQMLAMSLPFLSFANVIRTQYLIPKEKDKIYIISVILGAITNLIMNLIFIPRFGAVGAAIGTIAAEIIVMIYQSICVKNDIYVKKYLKISFNSFIKSIIMFAIIYPINYIAINPAITIMIQIFLGVIIYTILNFKYIIKVIDLNKIIKKPRMG